MRRFERCMPNSTSLPADGGATTTVERPLHPLEGIEADIQAIEKGVVRMLAEVTA